MAYTSEQFIEKIKPYAIKDMQENKILASLTIAQAFIESNRGNSGLTQKANNLFGIKGEYNGKSITMQTKEYVNGVYISCPAAFRKYPSWLESINDHSAFLKKYKRYASIIGETDYKKACDKMGKSGYATAPSYGTTLLSTIEKYELYKIDNEAMGTTPAAADPQQTVAEIPIELYPTIKVNDQSLWSVLAQQRLNAKNFKTPINGRFSIEMKNVVIAFQGANNLVKDGIIGQKTWHKLME